MAKKALMAATARQMVSSRILEPNPQLDELIDRAEQEVQFRTAAMNGIIDDLKKLADEIDPPGKNSGRIKTGNGLFSLCRSSGWISWFRQAAC